MGSPGTGVRAGWRAGVELTQMGWEWGGEGGTCEALGAAMVRTG